MKNINIAFLLIMIFCFFGCSTKTKFDLNQQSNNTHTNVTLQKNKKIYIGTSIDGTYKNKIYTGSGKKVSHYISNAVAAYSFSNKIDDQNDVNALCINAIAYGADYLFIPIIKHWEQRAAAWSGIPTRVTLAILVYNPSTKEQLITKEMVVTGKSMTFVSQYAEDLAYEAVEKMIPALFN